MIEPAFLVSVEDAVSATLHSADRAPDRAKYIATRIAEGAAQAAGCARRGKGEEAAGWATWAARLREEMAK
jgi:hypothetical protein